MNQGEHMETTTKINKFTNLQYWFKEYQKDHTTQGNIRTHYIGVPAVTLSLLGLLNPISFNIGTSSVTATMILLLVAMLWYVILDVKLAALIAIPMATLYYMASLISFEIHVVIHIISWALQLIGHYKYEGKSPSFFKSLPQLLIGPIFIYCKAIDYNWRKKG
jgi:uncharacterized membrane protein YGL010W